MSNHKFHSCACSVLLCFKKNINCTLSKNTCSGTYLRSKAEQKQRPSSPRVSYKLCICHSNVNFLEFLYTICVSIAQYFCAKTLQRKALIILKNLIFLLSLCKIVRHVKQRLTTYFLLTCVDQTFCSLQPFSKMYSQFLLQKAKRPEPPFAFIDPIKTY